MSFNINAESIRLLGKTKRLKTTPQRFFLEANEGTLELMPYSERILRVGVHWGATPDIYFSYAVERNAKPTTLFSSQETPTHIHLSGECFDIEINKADTALSFKTKAGQVLLEDEEGLTTALLGTETTVFKKLHSDEAFMGLGEKAGDFNRRGKCYTNRNTDSFAFGEHQDPLYSTIPFFIGAHSNVMYGVFVDNTYTTEFNFGVSTDRFFSFRCEHGTMYYYFIYGESVAQIVEQYTALTGRMPMPPLWSIGYHQSRYSYYPEYKIEEVVEGFERRAIPLDAIHFDIHYMDAYKAFTFDKKRFPRPKKLIDQLKKKGIQVVPILDPGIKVEPSYAPYEEGIKKDVFVKYADARLYSGGVWPGTCHFPDFTRPKVREWWANLCSFYTQLGIDALWNDMNEPAVWGQAFPSHTLFDYDGRGATFKKARNVYGLLMAKSSLEGLQKKQKNKRHFLLTRACYAGIQRYAAKWTGDNVASDEHLLLAARMVSSLGISGVAFSGSDVGGFVANSDGSLFARWISLGCFTPFFRSHKMINSNSSEPWCFGEEVEQIAKNYIRLRYRLTPYLYTHFFYASSQGTPINKPMAFYHPHEAWAYQPAFQNQFIHGHSFLICPLDSKTEYLPIYFPEGHWVDFYTDNLYEGGTEQLWKAEKESIPVFVKDGSIIPMQQVLPHLHHGMAKELELHIYLFAADRATGEFYVDDGTSLEYATKKRYNMFTFTYEKSTKTLHIQSLHSTKKTEIARLKIYLHGVNERTIHVANAKKTTTVQMKNSTYTVLHAIPNFDPFLNCEQGLKAVAVFEGSVPM